MSYTGFSLGAKSGKSLILVLTFSSFKITLKSEREMLKGQIFHLLCFLFEDRYATKNTTFYVQTCLN